MKRPSNKTVDHFAPRQQRNWDWRAAANFIAGGAGGGLLLLAALSGIGPGETRAALVLGMVLVGAGLTCVWFEIGQPWRALNVYLHIATSWMTREAAAALLLFVAGTLAWFSGEPTAIIATGLLGLAFLYCQARILGANKGIPSWRHPRSLALLMSTGLVEGAGFLACILALSSAVVSPVLLLALLILIALRASVWRYYLAGLANNAVPQGALKVLHGIDKRFLLMGHLLPALLLTLLWARPNSSVAFAATLLTSGLLLSVSGWWMKFTLVRRAAFTQGIALPHLPTRGRGAAGPAVKPGWGSTG